MSRLNRGRMAAMGCGLALALLAGSAQAGAKPSEKHAKLVAKGEKGAEITATRAAAKAPAVAKPTKMVAMPITVKIRPAQVAVVPPAPAREPVLLPVTYTEDAVPARPIKTAPVRAYARDGSSFYQNGQLIRIQGVADVGNSGEHAKQRLQQLLDAGQVLVLPVDGAGADGMLAVVRVNGRDLAEALGSN